jgi:hypothetical protein
LEYHQNKINYLNLEIAKLEILKNEEKAKWYIYYVYYFHH